MANRFCLNPVSYHGYGAIDSIPTEVRSHHFKKALLVTDPGLVKCGVVDNVTKILEKEGLAYEIYDSVKPNPTIENVLDGVKAFHNSSADYILAVGGGSAMDTSKAIAIIVANPEFGDVRSLEGVAPTKNPCVPILAVPTTAGTAAEVTINYVITDEEKHRKFVCVDPHDMPIVAFVDPLMMSSMPKSLTAATGMDAMTHAIEGLITKGAWELSDCLHLEAIKLIGKHLRSAYAGEKEGREGMALAEYVAGMGFSNVGLGIVHSMAHPLSALYDTPHGVACSILLPTGMRYNVDHTGEKYRDLARAMGVEHACKLPLDEVREKAIEAVEKLSKDVGIPASLKGIVKEEDLDFLAESAMADACMGGNPRTPTKEEVIALYRSLM